MTLGNSGLPEGVRGTYAGLIEKLPYLRDLGISLHHTMRTVRVRIRLARWTSFAMIKALHRADIEVILDLVFNHTAEGDHRWFDWTLSTDMPTCTAS